MVHFGSYLSTSDLQLGFKGGFSADLCTGVLKNVVNRYTASGSKVFACFLDASKAFDRVRYDILFCLLLDRKMPIAVVRFLLTWYTEQKLLVHWNMSASAPRSESPMV